MFLFILIISFFGLNRVEVGQSKRFFIDKLWVFIPKLPGLRFFNLESCDLDLSKDSMRGAMPLEIIDIQVLDYDAWS